MPKAKIRLTIDDKRKLLLALHEMAERGLPLPKEVKAIFKQENKIWPVAPNGYFVRRDGKIFTPYEEQEGFINSRAVLCLFRSGRGGGKTGSGAQKALKKLQKGLSGAVVNPDFENFKYSTWPEFREWIPWNMVVPSQRHRAREEWEPHQPFTMVFTNGARAYCKGLKSEDSGVGANNNWLWYDEGARDKDGKPFKKAFASVRVGEDPQAWVTTTPKGRYHWIYELFEEKKFPDEVWEAFEQLGNGRQIVEGFFGSIAKNKANLDPMFYASILATYNVGYLKSQEVDGEYAEEGGKIGDAAWFKGKLIDYVLPEQTKILRYWDLAATEKKQGKEEPDEAVGSLISKHKGEMSDKPRFQIQDQVAGYWSEDNIIETIANVARNDGPFIEVWIEQEPAASGKIAVAAVKKYFKQYPELQSHTVKGLDVKKVGDRVSAANLLWFNVAADGRMYMTKAAWNDKTLKQIDGFTLIEHDDRVTSITNGMFILNPFKLWRKTPFVTI
jgi:phage terminase large subunit-like protein